MMRFLLLVILFSGWSQAGWLDEQSAKIGYINIDQIVTNSPQFIQTNQEVIKEFQPQKDNLVKLSKQIQILADKFNRISNTLNQDEHKSEINKIAKLERQLKRRVGVLKDQLELRNAKELTKIQDTINRVIEEVAKEGRFDLILYQKVAYASKKINITPIISQKLRLLFE